MTTQPTLTDSLSSFGEMQFNIKFNDAFVDPGETPVDTTHIHGCYEIYLNLSGEVSFLHDLSVFEVLAGDLIISRPGDLHCCLYHGPCKHEHFCLWFEEGEVGDFLDRSGIRGHLRLSSEDRARLTALFFELLDRSADPFLRSAYFHELIALLGRSESKKREREALPEKVSDLLSYIDENFRTITYTAQIAEKFFISEPTVNRMIRKNLGISVHKLIEAKKLSYAESLLKGGKSVTEACYLSGFSDCSRFILRFKEKFGTTPHKYRVTLEKSKN